MYRHTLFRHKFKRKFFYVDFSMSLNIIKKKKMFVEFQSYLHKFYTFNIPSTPTYIKDMSTRKKINILDRFIGIYHDNISTYVYYTIPKVF